MVSNSRTRDAVSITIRETVEHLLNRHLCLEESVSQGSFQTGLALPFDVDDGIPIDFMREVAICSMKLVLQQGS